MTTGLQISDFADGQIRALLDLRVYRLAAIKKTAYRLAGAATVAIGKPEKDLVPVTLMFQPGTTESRALAALRLFFEELLDQELREHVGEETASIRTLILAQAFSKTNLIGGE